MSYYPSVMRAIGGSEKIFEYVDRQPQVPPEGTLAPQNLEGHVEFKNVTFTYPTREDTPVLKVSTVYLQYTVYTYTGYEFK